MTGEMSWWAKYLQHIQEDLRSDPASKAGCSGGGLFPQHWEVAGCSGGGLLLQHWEVASLQCLRIQDFCFVFTKAFTSLLRHENSTRALSLGKRSRLAWLCVYICICSVLLGWDPGPHMCQADALH